MNKEFFDALDVIEKERNIKKEVLLEKITKAMEVAVSKDLGIEGNVRVEADEKKKNFTVHYVSLKKKMPNSSQHYIFMLSAKDN